MAAGTQNWWERGNNNNAAIAPTSMFGNPSSFTAAANTQAKDYDTIMSQYDNVIKSAGENPLTAGTVKAGQVGSAGSANFNPTSASHVNFNPMNPSESIKFNSVAPQTAEYSQSGDVTNSLANLSELSRTGGYSEAGIADIRARDISPIRSIYANAQENMSRNRAISGGYSPNFNAASGQLSRDEANKIGDVTTAANAGIAQNVAANRISAASPYATAAANANSARTAADQKNAEIINSANRFNSEGTYNANKTNVDNAQKINEFNAEGAFNANKTNAASADAANKFNSEGALETQKYNLGNENRRLEGNVDRATKANEFNTTSALEAGRSNRANVLGAIQGKSSLYGTTPALTNTFGNQVTQAGQIGQNQQQLNDARQRNLLSFAGRG